MFVARRRPAHVEAAAAAAEKPPAAVRRAVFFAGGVAAPGADLAAIEPALARLADVVTRLGRPAGLRNAEAKLRAIRAGREALAAERSAAALAARQAEGRGTGESGKLAAIERRLREADREVARGLVVLQAEREKFEPALAAAVAPSVREAAQVVAEAVAMLGQAAVLLREVDRATVAQGHRRLHRLGIAALGAGLASLAGEARRLLGGDDG